MPNHYATSCSEKSIRAGFRAVLDQTVPTLGVTAPNPAVGCALLDRQGRVLAVGVHPRAGSPHAEVMALEAAERTGVLSQVYVALVTLEPCVHQGRTPPCSERLRHSPVQEVWIGARDPNPVAAGGGTALGQGDRAKRVLFLEDMPRYADLALECRALLAPFASTVMRGRPWISVKQALDRSGQMEPPAGQKTFTSMASLRFAHRLRRATDAVVTGITTVLRDAPAFTVRGVADHEGRKSRLLVVCDRQNRLPTSWVRTREADGFTVVRCADISTLPVLLQQHGVAWAMIEAGPILLKVVEALELWDDWLTIQQGAPGRADSLSVRMREPEGWGASPIELLRLYGERG